jgi:LysM repeat protein
MNNPNPFIPQGSLVEQMNKKRARVKMAVLAIFSGTILLIAPVLLIQGCKRDQSAQDNSSDNSTPTADTNNLAPTPDASSLAASSNAAPAPNTGATAPNMAPAAAPNMGANTMATTAPQAPTMTPAATPVSEPPASAATSYVVVAHDTLAGIAKKFNVKLKDLEAANPGVVATKLKVGAPLNIPSGGSASPSTMASTMDSSTGEDVYTVKPGDNLTKIAHTSGTTVKALMALNNMSTTRINAGQKLKLPAKTAAASPMESIPAATATTTTTASNPTSSTSSMH